MKPTLSLLLLVSSLLLSSNLCPAAGRPHLLPPWLEDSGLPQGQRLEDVLLGDTQVDDDGAESNLLKLLLLFLMRSHPELFHQEEEKGSDDAALRTAVAAQLLKRSAGPPSLSIDLPLHLLRNMVEIAKAEKQAQINRERFEEVGK
ncbi:urotensin 1 isoform X2 [Cynoglossus semilaevis]|uniref:UI-like n=2 Tax=Cynoglossus semilaevis TaxID=244447 RepID=A0A3P8V1V1_CYNSE|nr:UI-like isoform X2 [Cynoglossus semilaevis]